MKRGQKTMNTIFQFRVWLLLAALQFLVCGRLLAAATSTILYSFTGAPDGNSPMQGLVFDADGNLYGTSEGGGILSTNCPEIGCGTVFELTPNGDGTWTKSTIFTFDGVGVGSSPAYGSLLMDSAGNLYGVASSGSGATEFGLIFELSKSGVIWRETILHTFSGGNDGGLPYGRLALDGMGNLYGTTFEGGRFNSGTVFQLNKAANWAETVLHNFSASGKGDGMFPIGGVLIDSSGNLYGTTSRGGNLVACGGGCGVVFEMSPTGASTWKYTVLWTPNGKNGNTPYAPLAMDKAGSLYGTTTAAATHPGTAFKLTLQQTGKWKGTIIHNFSGGTDGGTPVAGLTLDAQGNVYGVTNGGGAEVCGTVFKLTPGSTGNYILKVLHSFLGSGGNDGAAAQGTLILDASGNLYGTTAEGGTGGFNDGTVFEVKP